MDPRQAPFRVGDLTVDPVLGRVSRGEEEARRVRPLVMHLLVMLARQPGQVVSKDQIIATVWNGAAIADSVLSSTIAELRQILGDESQHPTFIETLPKRGYRLIATVSPVHVRLDPAPVSAQAATTVPRGHLVSALFGAVAVVGLLSLVAVTLPAVRGTAPIRDASPVRLVVTLPRGARMSQDIATRLAIARDASRLVFSARVGDSSRLFVRELRQSEAREISHTEGATSPFLSPSGARLGFFAGGALRTVGFDGGPSAAVCDVSHGLGASWGADDVIVFVGQHGGGLSEVPAQGGVPRVVTMPDASAGEIGHRWPEVLPGGDVVFTSVRRTGRAVIGLRRATGERRLLMEDADFARFAAPDRLVFGRGNRVFAAPFDLSRLTVTGQPVQIVDDASSSPGNSVVHFAVADSGALVYVPVDADDASEMVWVDRAGRVSPVGVPKRRYMHPRLSPDGRKILTWTRGDDGALWVIDLQTRSLTRLITDGPAQRGIWNHAGTRIIFGGPFNGLPTLFWIPTGGGPAQRFTNLPGSVYTGTASASQMAMVAVNRQTSHDILLMGPEGDGAPVPLLRSAAAETAPAFSHDERWLAFVSNHGGSEQVYLLDRPWTGTPLQLSHSGGREPVWSRSSNELFFRDGDAVMSVEVAGTGASVGEPRELFRGAFDFRPSFLANYDTAPDGRFVMVRTASDEVSGTQIAILLNWRSPAAETQPASSSRGRGARPIDDR